MTLLVAANGVRDITISDGGDNANNGSGLTYAKRTFKDTTEDGILREGAETALLALDPPPQLLVPASLVDVGASRYVGELNIPDNVQVSLQFCSVQGVTPATPVISAGENSQATFLTISTALGGGSTAYLADSKNRVNIDSRAIVCNGTGDTAVRITGTSSETFNEIGQILLRQDNSTAMHFDSTGAKARSLRYNVINMEGAGCTGILYEGTSSEDLAIHVANLTDTGGVGNKALHIKSGKVACFTNVIQCETAIHVEAGARLGIFNAHITGDIIVDAGGVLNISALDHTGNVINAGTINGIIAGVDYGSYIDADDIGYNFQKAGTILNSPSDYGHVTIDTTTDAFDSILYSYIQSSSSSITVTIEIVDADTPTTVYFSSSNTVAATGNHFAEINLVTDEVTALPVDQVVNLQVRMNRTGSAGVSSGNCQMDLIRTTPP